VHNHAHSAPVPGVPLALSAVATGLGLLVYLRVDKVKAVLDGIRYPVTSNGVYCAALKGLSSLAKGLDRRQMTGFLRDYVAYIFGAMILAFAALLLWVAFPQNLSYEFGPMAIW